MGEKSAKKEKKAKRESSAGEDVVPSVSTEYLAPIAKPLADDKLSKKVCVSKSPRELIWVCCVLMQLDVHAGVQVGQEGCKA